MLRSFRIEDNNSQCYLCHTYLPEGPTYQEHVEKCILRRNSQASQRFAVARRRPLHTIVANKSNPIVIDTTSKKKGSLLEDLDNCDKRPVQGNFAVHENAYMFPILNLCLVASF